MKGRIGKREVVISSTNQEKAEKWMEYIGTVYEEYQSFFEKGGVEEDVLNDTIIKCYDAIRRNGLEDDSEQGMKNYLFMAMRRNKIAVFNDSYRKRKVCIDDVKTDIEDCDYTSQLLPQIYSDFVACYLENKVGEVFPAEDAYCWRVKQFVPQMTYKKIADVTGIKRAKAKVVGINKWLINNVSKEEIDAAFEEFCDY